MIGDLSGEVAVVIGGTSGMPGPAQLNLAVGQRSRQAWCGSFMDHRRNRTTVDRHSNANIYFRIETYAPIAPALPLGYQTALGWFAGRASAHLQENV